MPKEYEMYIIPGVVLASTLLFLVKRIFSHHDEIPYLILTEFYASDAPQNGMYIAIAGRPAGIWSIVKAFFGFGTKVHFQVTQAIARLREKKTNSQIQISVPLQNIGSTRFAYTKSIFFLFFTLLLMLSGGAVLGLRLGKIEPLRDWTMELVYLVMACCEGLAFISLLGFLLSKRMIIEIETGGGDRIGVQFKPKMIGNNFVDIQAAQYMVEIINARISGTNPYDESRLAARLQPQPAPMSSPHDRKPPLPPVMQR